MIDAAAERTADIFVKQERITSLMREVGCDGLLVLDPADFCWLTAGAEAKGITNVAEHPCLFFQGQYRWVLCANVDTHRLFDEELDGLGFQLKEWPWQWGRAQLLADLCHGKKVAADVPFSDCVNVGDRLRRTRHVLTPWEQGQLRNLGKSVAHALEATCRNLERGESEEEIGGQLSHRLVHHGIEPIAIQVSSDGRLRRHRRGGPTRAVPQQYCVLQATARRWGLHVTASRTVRFAPLAKDVGRDFDMACRYSALQIACSIARTKSSDILRMCSRMLEMAGFEHEWRLFPVGWRTGFMPVEEMFFPAETSDVLEAGMAVVWPAAVGAAMSTDTMLVTEQGPEVVTVLEQWPLKYIKVASLVIQRPDILVREPTLA